MTKPTPYEYAAWTLAALSILFTLHFRVLSALIAGLLVYELVHTFSPFFARHLSPSLPLVQIGERGFCPPFSAIP